MSEKGLTSRMPQFNSALAHQQNKPETHIGAKAPEGVSGTTAVVGRSISDTIVPGSLPPGKTCGDCTYFRRCESLFSCSAKLTGCDWIPSRFRERSASDEECDQCGAKRQDWQHPEQEFCPNHANPYGSCDGILRRAGSLDRVEGER